MRNTAVNENIFLEDSHKSPQFAKVKNIGKLPRPGILIIVWNDQSSKGWLESCQNVTHPKPHVEMVMSIIIFGAALSS